MKSWPGTADACVNGLDHSTPDLRWLLSGRILSGFRQAEGADSCGFCSLR